MMATVGFAHPLLFFRNKSIDKSHNSRTERVSSSSSSFSSAPPSSSSSSSSETFHRTDNGQVIHKDVLSEGIMKKKKRVFFLDVSPLCYEGNKPSSHAFGYWVSLFFSQVSLNDPVIAVKTKTLFSSVSSITSFFLSFFLLSVPQKMLFLCRL